MKGTTKRILAMLLAVILSLPLGIAANADNADTSSAPTLFDGNKPITHWDFEGEGNDVYADKATEGATADALTASGSVTVADGAAMIDDTEVSSYMKASAPEGSDLYSMKNKTIVIRAQVEKGSTVSGIWSKDSLFAYGVANNGEYGKIYYNGTASYVDGKISINSDEYRTYVMTVEYSADIGTTIAIYMSANATPSSSDDFILMAHVTGDISVDGAKDIYVGKRGSDHSAAVRNLKMLVDDIKIYDEVLLPSYELTAHWSFAEYVYQNTGKRGEHIISRYKTLIYLGKQDCCNKGKNFGRAY